MSEARAALRNYTRWTEVDGELAADILGSQFDIAAHRTSGHVVMNGVKLSPDEARMVGVRLIEGAALADGDRAVRAASRAVTS